jgi:hypothetical protein
MGITALNLVGVGVGVGAGLGVEIGVGVGDGTADGVELDDGVGVGLGVAVVVDGGVFLTQITLFPTLEQIRLVEPLLAVSPTFLHVAPIFTVDVAACEGNVKTKESSNSGVTI